MKLIVGLGNPGKKFAKTKHNLGFLVLNELRKKWKFEKFNYEKKFLAKISEGKFNGQEIILAKPQTFMNNSGKSVKSLISNFKIQNSHLWIVHDDLDIPLGKIKISFGRGAGGHKGVQSIIYELKTGNFLRFRIGILPKNKNLKKIKNFVLKKFTKHEEKIVKEMIQKTVKAIEISLKEGIEKSMQEFNKKTE